MCGIVGYIGGGQAAPFLLEGLQKLEYRGYDSAGVAVFSEGHLKTVKAKGRLQVLSELLSGGTALPGTVGIGHTRWATHGAPNEQNAHPQVSEGGRFAVVHNGIIENYRALREKLQESGVRFMSETDTETAAQLLEQYYDGDILNTIRRVTDELQGSYALGILCAEHPDRLYAVRKDSPLIVGLGQGENFIASDIPAILSKTREICRLQDGEIAVLSADSAEFFTADGKQVEKKPEHITWDAEAAEKGGYAHFMLKEIFEQPKAVRDTIQPRIQNGRVKFDFELSEAELQSLKKICVVACGTAYHVGVAAKYALESLLRLPVEVDVSSEFRYRAPILDAHTLVIMISQSGETADTLAALREAKRRGSRVLSIVNVVGSTIAAESDDVIYTWAGPEISVASTKAYSTQLAVIWLLALYMGERLHTLTGEQLDAYVRELESLPEKIEMLLSKQARIKAVAEQLYTASDIYFIGRGMDY
ncbi:MAG: glutamine--fructose-6-phosphate transaminase (isomerizing), partial [Clostridia bacterium]|nr:glutamine--fructose-6-phosphate transaminase (isomerizing) [Clostridia bacterium]